MSARREPVAPTVFPEHVFAPNIYGPRDKLTDRPLECLVVAGGRRCLWPEANAVHKSSEELAEALPPVPDEDVSKRITGESE